MTRKVYKHTQRLVGLGLVRITRIRLEFQRMGLNGKHHDGDGDYCAQFLV